jgi:hypothetical protein
LGKASTWALPNTKGDKVMSSSVSGVSINIGAGIGSMIAVAISWSINQSIWWAFWHGIFGWFYVIYYACGNGR